MKRRSEIETGKGEAKKGKDRLVEFKHEAFRNSSI
jgi:hypothetical protein